MQTCKCKVRLDQLGSDTPKFGVTPVELMILREAFGHYGGEPVIEVELTGNVQRTYKEEEIRLRSLYGALRVKQGTGDIAVCDKYFSNPLNKLPEKFSEIPDFNGANLPTAKFDGPEQYNPIEDKADLREHGKPEAPVAFPPPGTQMAPVPRFTEQATAPAVDPEAKPPEQAPAPVNPPKPIIKK